MAEKTDVWQGTMTLMVLRTLEAMGPQHGYGLARRIEQTSGDLTRVLDYFGVSALTELSSHSASRAITSLEKQRRSA